LTLRGSDRRRQSQTRSNGKSANSCWLVEEIIGNRPVDLIEVEGATESLRQAVERYGIEL